jgi:hypothetical protein
MCSALVSSIPCSLPVWKSQRAEACFRVVMRQELRLSLDNILEALLKDMRDALVAVLTARAEQRLISHLMGQRVLERIFELREETRLIEKLSGL